MVHSLEPVDLARRYAVTVVRLAHEDHARAIEGDSLPTSSVNRWQGGPANNDVGRHPSRHAGRAVYFSLMPMSIRASRVV